MFFAKVFCLKKSGFAAFLCISGQTGHRNPVTGHTGAIRYGFQADSDVQSNSYAGTCLFNRNRAGRNPYRIPVELQYPY